MTSIADINEENEDNIEIIKIEIKEEIETQTLEVNDDEDAISYPLRVHPTAPPSTKSYDENLGGKVRSPNLCSIQLNSSGKNVSCLMKIGSKGYLMSGIMTRKKLEFKTSGRLDYQFQFILKCERQKSHKCNLSYLLYCRKKNIEHRDFFKLSNFLPGKFIPKSWQRTNFQKQLESHLESCFFEDALEKHRGLYSKTMVKMNCTLEKPLKPAQMRSKIAELCKMTPPEAAEFCEKKLNGLKKMSSRYDRRLKK